MASIRLGAVVSEIAGSLDGVVYSHNRNGRYVRARVKPTNPRSVKQTVVRGGFASLSQQWRTLTAAQRTAWASLGAQMTQTNRLGEATTLTGNQAFISINQLKLTAGQATVTAAPVLDAAPTIILGAIVTTVAAAGTLTIASTTVLATGQTMRVYATGPLSQGRTFFRRSQYKLMQTVTAPFVSPIDMKAAWVATYGAIGTPIVGAKISILITPVSANGIEGTPTRIDSIWS